jgi:hypothetical protein
MKINPSKIKRWGFKQRLHEIKKRVDAVWDDPGLSRDSAVILSEAQNIIDYWITHMEGPVEPEKPKKGKKKKPQNLWDEVL